MADKQLLLATSNRGKVKEMQAILAPYDWQVLSLSDLGGYVPPEEDGDSFLANATIKASAACEFSGLIALADDSGLCVEALNGAPGIHSARFAEDDPSYTDGHDAANNRKLLRLLENVALQDRKAYFCCVMVLAYPDHVMYSSEGRIGGRIALLPQGDGGFGYDPLFYLAQYGKTFAELGPDVKNHISHRAKALNGILPVLQQTGRV